MTMSVTQQVNREQFLTRLQSVQGGLSNSEKNIAQATCFAFKDGFVLTFNNKIACSHKSGLEADFMGAVPAKNLLDILPLMPDETLEIETTDTHFIVRGNSRTLRIVMEKEIMLAVKAVEKPGDWWELPEIFKDALEVVQSCLGKSGDGSRYVLSCVHFKQKSEDGPAFIESCDNLQMARYKVNIGLERECLVEGEDLKYIIDFGMTEFAETEAWLHFKNKGGLILSYRRAFQDYPKLTHHLTNLEGEDATLPTGLGDAVERAGKCSATNGKTNKVLVELRPGKLRIKANGSLSEYEEDANVKYNGRPMAFMISPIILDQITQKHNDCKIGPGKLFVNGGKFHYVSILADPKQAAEEERKAAAEKKEMAARVDKHLKKE